MPEQPVYQLLVGLIGIVLLYLIFSFLKYYRPWLSARISGVRIGIIELYRLQWIRIDPVKFLDTLILVEKAELPVNREQIKQAYLAGADLKKVTYGLLAAKKAGIDLSFTGAVSYDLAGLDLLNLVQQSIRGINIEKGPEEVIFSDGSKWIGHLKVCVKAGPGVLIQPFQEEELLQSILKALESILLFSDDPRAMALDHSKLAKEIRARSIEASPGIALDELFIEIKPLNT